MNPAARAPRPVARKYVGKHENLGGKKQFLCRALPIQLGTLIFRSENPGALDVGREVIDFVYTG